MVNETNIITKLTKGLKFKIIKKKKNNWKTLNSNDSLPTSPDEEYMLYSDTEYELNHVKANIESNRSFSFNNLNDENNYTKNTSNNVSAYGNIGRSKTYNNSRSVAGLQPHIKNLYTQNSRTDSSKSQTSSTIHPLLKNKHSSFIINKHLTSSYNPTAVASAPNSPISLDAYDTCFIDIKANSNNPFLNMKPKDISTTKKDPVLEPALISPIEFDSTGKVIEKSVSSTPVTPTVSFVPQQSTPLKQTTTNIPDPLFRNKSVKRIKPLITFDTPPIVSPITTETDTEEYTRSRNKRNSKKHKKYSKKRSSPLTVKTTIDKDSTREKVYSEPTSAIVARANSRLKSPDGYNFNNEEDDDVPLGIIQYKCISSILKDVGPTTISSLQSNTKKSQKSKSNYGYMTPPHDAYYEKYDFPKFNNNYSSNYQENYVI